MTQSLEAYRQRWEECRGKLSLCHARLHNLIERNTDGVLVIGREGAIRFANRAAEVLLGRPADELRGQVIGIPVIPGETTELDIPGARALRGVAEMRVAEIEWEGQLAYLASLRDITERYRANEAMSFLAEASKVFSQTLDYATTLRNVARMAVAHLADWCLVDLLGEDGCLRRTALDRGDPVKDRLLSELAAEVFRPDEDAALGLPCVLRTGRPEIHAEVPEALLRTLVAGPHQLETVRALRGRAFMLVPLPAGGRVLGAITFAAAESGRTFGPPELALAEDLACRAALALENARLYEQSRDAVRRRDDFLAMLAHELRNPLAPIRNVLDIVAAAPDPESFRKVREILVRQVQHLVRLVDDLLDVARVTSGKIRLRKERVELTAVLTQAVEIARPLLERHRQGFAMELPATPVWLQADPTRLAQVVANLLNNAAKYTPEGGQVRLRAERAADEVIIEIQDDGVGIAPELLPHVFDQFVQADRSLARSQGGLGLGLSLVRSLTELHGGRVSADSGGPGKGSTFRVRLPLAAAPETAACPPPAAAAIPVAVTKPRASAPRTLVVDDNADAACTLGMLLELDGCEVRVAHDGPTAIKTADAFQPDVILLDIGLPGMDGYQVARHLRGQPQFARTRLVAMTGYGQDDDRRRALAEGFDLHLTKPVDVAALQHAIGRHA